MCEIHTRTVHTRSVKYGSANNKKKSPGSSSRMLWFHTKNLFTELYMKYMQARSLTAQNKEQKNFKLKCSSVKDI